MMQQVQSPGVYPLGAFSREALAKCLRDSHSYRDHNGFRVEIQKDFGWPGANSVRTRNGRCSRKSLTHVTQQRKDTSV